MLLAPCQTSWSRTRDTFVTETVISFNPFSHLCDKLLFPGLKVLRGSHVKRVKIFANSFVFEHAECLNSFCLNSYKISFHVHACLQPFSEILSFQAVNTVVFRSHFGSSSEHGGLLRASRSGVSAVPNVRRCSRQWWQCLVRPSAASRSEIRHSTTRPRVEVL